MSREKFHPVPDAVPPVVTQATRRARFFGHALERVILGSTIIDPHRTLQKLGEEPIRNEGTIFIFTHFGRGDLLPLLFNLICSEYLRDKPAIAPQSWHQYNERVGGFIQKLAGRLLPMVNENTERHPSFMSLDELVRQQIKDQLDLNFLQMSTNILQVGGLVAMAIDPGRSPYLNMNPEHLPLTILHLKMKRDKLQQMRRDLGRKVKTEEYQAGYGIVPIALSLEGVTDYSLENVGKLNLRQHYVLTIGERITSQEVSTLSSEELELMVRYRLLDLVPNSYIDPIDQVT